MPISFWLREKKYNNPKSGEGALSGEKFASFPGREVPPPFRPKERASSQNSLYRKINLPEIEQSVENADAGVTAQVGSEDAPGGKEAGV